MVWKFPSADDPCPCGSEKRYRDCCWDGTIDRLEEELGVSLEDVTVPDELMEAFQQWGDEFMAEHGREPTADDLFPPDLPDEAEPPDPEIAESLRQAGVDPAYIHAYEQTGILSTSGDADDFESDSERADWITAVVEYRDKHDAWQKPPDYPIGTVALYGPDDTKVTKIVAGVLTSEDAEAIVKRWVGTKLKDDPKVAREMQEFFASHNVQSVAVSDGVMGCPHEEGPDFPVGEDCPFCPFWKGKQGSARRE